MQATSVNNNQSNTISTSQYFDDRFYRIYEDEKEFVIPSVTTKLGIESKPFLYRYYAELGWDQARKKLREAGDRGTRIHYAWYLYQSGGVVLYNPFNRPNFAKTEINELTEKYIGRIMILENQDEMNDLWKLQKFDQIVKPQFKQPEFTVYSVEDDIAGTLDGAFYLKKGTYAVNGRQGLVVPKSGIYIFDLKTGAVSESAWAQLAAYLRGFEVMGLGGVEGGIVLHTGSKTRSGINGFSSLLKTKQELKPHYEIYQHLSAVWKARNPNAGITSFQFPNLIAKEIAGRDE